MNRETYDEQGPIREQELPEVEVSEVRIRDEQSRTVVRGIPLVHEEPRQADRTEAGSRVAICPWDYQPVAEPGDTCDFDCYQSWWAWYYGLRNGLNDGVVRLSSDDLPPKDLTDQPWYGTMVGVSDETEKQQRAYWLCLCTSWYSGEGPNLLFDHEPDEDECHRMGGCGWVTIQWKEEVSNA